MTKPRPSKDASGALSEAEQVEMGSHGPACRFPDDTCECTVPLFEHRRIVSAAATRARAEERERIAQAIEALSASWDKTASRHFAAKDLRAAFSGGDA